MNKQHSDHYYVLDSQTGIIYRTVGVTASEQLISYPKYIPDMNGNRSNNGHRYSSFKFPTESLRFILNSSKWTSHNVQLAYSDTYGLSLPTANKATVSLFEPKIELLKRIEEDGVILDKLRVIVNLIIGETSELSNSDFGLDGSLLVNLFTSDSDIDLIVYGKEQAYKVAHICKQLISKGLIQCANSNQSFFISRRKPYSALMSDKELIEWETQKIGGVCDGIKFSVMPKDINMLDLEKYSSSYQYSAVLFTLKKDQIIFDPGYILIDEIDDLHIVFGPKNISIKKIVSHLPEKIGTLLEKHVQYLFVGILYQIRETNEWAITQFVWDDYPEYNKKRFVFKHYLDNDIGQIDKFLNFETD